MNQREEINQETTAAHPGELTQEGIARRNVLKAGAVGAGAAVLGLNVSTAEAANACPLPGVDIVSPRVTPFKDPLQRLFHIVPLGPVSPDPVQQPFAGGGPAGIFGITGGQPQPHPVPGQVDSKFKLLADHPELATATPYPDLAHQAWVDPASPLYFPPVDFYEMHMVQHNHIWHSEMPAGAAGQPAWGFAPPDFNLNAAPLTAGAPSIVPGPCFRTVYGKSHFVRIHNDLPDVATPDAVSPLGFGTPVITTHMHNQHTPSESDGNPLYYNYPGMFYDYHYPNVYAGVLQGFKSPVRGVAGDWREAGGSFWYHDHKLDFTSQNVYAGVAGFNCTYDECDTGDETQVGSTGIRFPTHSADSTIPFEFDVPLVVHDRQFDAAGVDFFPLACFDGAIGDALTVNGTIQPFMNVQPRRYRFRILDMGPSRFYWWWMRQGLGANFIPFIVISNDGNLLPNAVRVQSFKQAVAERFDVIVDFTGFKAGTEFFLVNRAEQVNGRSPTGKLLAPNQSQAAMKFVVEAKRPGLTDLSTPITQGTPLRPLPPKINPVGAKRKTWKFDRTGGEWAVNGIIFDRFAAPYAIPQGTAEQWDIVNGGGSWSHPVHIHYEEHRYFQYNGAAQPAVSAPLETGRKDVIRLDPGATVRIGMQFRDYKGIYPMHCHNVVHEDHAMMVMWKIV